MNLEIFAQYIILRILRRVLDARKFGVSENYNYNRTNRTNCYVHENLIMRTCLLEVDAIKFSYAKIYTFTVVILYVSYNCKSCRQGRVGQDIITS